MKTPKTASPEPLGFTIRADDLSGKEIQALLKQHLAHMHSVTEPGSVHALDIPALRQTAVSFWSAWQKEQLLGCAALKELDAYSGEIKSMRTRKPARGQGVASALLTHIQAVARQRGYRALYLETGAQAAFAGARAFYRHHGFFRRDAFGDYRNDGNSYFMELVL